MEERVIARKNPFAVEVEKGMRYAWCACGLSATQPFCDGSHVGTGLAPLIFEAHSSATLHLCGCKQTATPPYCDGTHTTL